MQNLSKEKQFIKMCTDAGFIKTVAPGQFFLTKDAEAFSEFDGMSVVENIQYHGGQNDYLTDVFNFDL